MRLVVHRFIDNFPAVHPPRGLGDSVRGSCSLWYALQRRSGEFRLALDWSGAKMDSLIRGSRSEEGRAIELFKHRGRGDLLAYILSVPEGNVIISTNAYPKIPLSLGCRAAMRDLLQPTPAFEEEIDQVVRPLGDYAVIHLRTGDGNLFNQGQAKSAELADRLLPSVEALAETISGNLVLLCDLEPLERRLSRESRRIQVLPGPMVHAGVIRHLNEAKHCLMHFFVLARARRIFQYSVYGWGSGFSSWPGQIFGVPLVGRRLGDLPAVSVCRPSPSPRVAKPPAPARPPRLPTARQTLRRRREACPPA